MKASKGSHGSYNGRYEDRNGLILKENKKEKHTMGVKACHRLHNGRDEGHNSLAEYKNQESKLSQVLLSLS